MSFQALRTVNAQNREILWHGVDRENLEDIFSRGTFKAYGKHRKFVDGNQRHDKDPEYNSKSVWICGWSMSRCFRVAENFGSVVFAFDKEKLRQNMYIKPYNYFSTIKNGNKTSYKKELEEFVTNGTIKLQIEDYEKKRNELLDKLDEISDKLFNDKENQELKAHYKKVDEEYENSPSPFNKWMNPEGKELPVDSSIGFFIKETDFENENRTELKNTLVNHPKFLGFI